MAIDSRDKRASAVAPMGIGRLLPLADAVVDAADRLHAWAYRGISVAVAAAGPVGILRITAFDGGVRIGSSDGGVRITASA